MHLNRQASRAMRITGSAILAAALTSASYAAWAMQAAPSPSATVYDMALEVDTTADTARLKLRMAAGEKAAVELGEGAQHLRATFIVNPAKDKTVYITTTLTQAGKIVGNPGLLVKVGEQAAVKYALADSKNVAMRLTVTPSALTASN